MATGKIKKIIEEKGFGFITPTGQEGKKNDVFFHASGLKGVEFDELTEGASVEYDTEDGEKGKRAINIRVI